ncbi:low affinity iron permease family protein [Sinorhizobium numidicum]|uniref:Low affinity iron permease family protein n=1 Tax=Sinorhizobium numidicum TaxID=680248 RepID=A0ABY8CT65_9HYPH|nr:low affinity iron permease family protein [Sinorhizobium numidicum]WEX74216.1 low affinity iron permease family protein [Sinorhizobium numidicum]WEX80201.1 low affinity iron permease family protein [Sinorhizobium numidicum]
MSWTTNRFGKFSTTVAEYTGRPVTFVLAVAVIVLWGLTGPWFGFSETWQLVVNTGTTIITFLMVFVLQNSQNRDGTALQAKLDELILTSSAENKFIGIEKLDEKELKRLSEILREHAQSEDDQALHKKITEVTGRRAKAASLE